MPLCSKNQHITVPGNMWCSECGSLITGTQIDDYTILSYMGQGSFGAVYLASQQSLNNRKVVIKMLQSSWSQEHVYHFQQEAAFLASLSHPYILTIYAYGVLNNQQGSATSYVPYFVLPYIEQGSLDDMLAQEGKHTMPLKQVVTIAGELADALDYAHSKGVLHRDVKPANILCVGSHVVLSDFGVATLIDADTSHLQASLAGSPAFMAPEVWRCNPGRYSDQYALAVTCFRLLTGDYPWHNAEGRIRDWTQLHCFVEPRSLHDHCPEISWGVDLALQRALAKDPHERYPSGGAFASDLRAAAEDTQMCIVPSLARTGYPQGGPLRTGPVVPVVPIAVQAQENSWVAHPQLGGSEVVTGRPVCSSYPIEKGTGKEHELFDVMTESLGDSTDIARRDTPVLRAFMLNLLICVLLAAQAALLSSDSIAAVVLLLLLWPSLLIGPVLAYLLKFILHFSIVGGILWGLLFGIIDALVSALICYGWTALAFTLTHWGVDWLHPGDGLHIYFGYIVKLAPAALNLIVPGSLLALVGGSLVGYLSVRAEGARPSIHQA
jgi:serine/threonine protein kinase